MSVADKKESPPANEDIEAVRHTTAEYFQAWYAGDADRIRQVLHPDLAKRTVRYDAAEGAWVLRHVDVRRVAELAGQGGGTDLPEADRWQEATVLDVSRNIASTKCISHEYIEYTHLARFGRRWLIVNTLWEPRA